MKNIVKKIILYSAISATFFLSSCSFDEVVDPNGPSVDGVESGATIGQLNELVIGVESSARNGHGVETTASGIMAREFYLFDGDPRNVIDLLGNQGTPLSSNSFYSTAQWNGSYRCIKNANLLIGAATNSDFITTEERNGYIGFAKTIIAYKLIQMVKSYDKARVDVADEENLGPILDADAAFTAIRTLLDEANTELGNASFIFPLSNGFNGFDDAANFRQFNRGIAAMAAVYDGDGQDSLDALNESYFSLNGDLSIGPKHLFALGGNDAANDLFKTPSTTVANQNNGDNIIVHNSWINDAEVGDTRVSSKSAPRPDSSPAAALSGLNGTHETRLYSSSTDQIDFLRNEELILIYAEASILAGNLDDAEGALNIIRNAANIGDKDYGVPTPSADQLTAEMLEQRRYSLWCENHRMFDLRRYDLSSMLLSVDRPEDRIYNVFPTPLAENQ